MPTSWGDNVHHQPPTVQYCYRTAVDTRNRSAWTLQHDEWRDPRFAQLDEAIAKEPPPVRCHRIPEGTIARIPGATERKCSRCKGTKPLKEFPKCSHTADGYASWCHACHRENYRRRKAEGDTPRTRAKRREA